MMYILTRAGRRGFWRTFLPIYLLVLVALANGASNVSLPVGESHKIQVSDPALANRIEAQGGLLIADYGNFRLYEVPKILPELLANTRAEIRDNYDLIRLNTGLLNTRKQPVRALSQPISHFQGKHLHLVQFAGPILPQWHDELESAGAQIVSYIPENSYLIYGSERALTNIQALAANSPHIQWQGVFRDEYKIHPRARAHDLLGRPQNIGTDLFEIQLVDDSAANTSTVALLDQLKLEPFRRQEHDLGYLNLVVRLDPKNLATVAAQPEVVAILPYFTPHPLCERADQIVAGNLSNGVPTGPGYLAWLASKGFTQSQFTASGFVVDVADSGVDNGTTSPNHFGLYTGGSVSNASRVAYARYERTTIYSTNSLEGCDGHGTINAHIIAGYDNFSGFPFTDTTGFHFGLGVCPFVNVGSSVIFDSAAGNAFYNPNFNNLESEAYHDGARISSDSWGQNSQGFYNSDCQRFDALTRDSQPTNSTFATDGNQEMVFVFAAGNQGPTNSSISIPASAKNVISVGAADNVQPFGAQDRSLIGDDQATNANEIASFSSRGPCGDGRSKPDIMAPGTHVSGGVIQATNDFVNFPDGIADSCFDGSEVSGGPNSLFWPTNQQFYTASSGTSQATPCVSGGCALVLQYFMNNFSNFPSAAMTKAFLMNSARYMTGATASDTLPSPNQGMGEMNLGMAFDSAHRILRDQVPDDLFTNTGQFRSFTGTVADTNRPFRVTLAWSDAPGSLSGTAWNNNLDLTVSVGGNTYRGNVFSNAFSIPGGAADGSNNVESVFLPAGTSSDFIVQVNAANINSIGVPNTNQALSQDFALVIYNGNSVPRPIIVPAGTTLTAETCSNNAIDPGEIVTVNFGLQNIGSADTTNLVATLLTNSGVTLVGGPQTYGSLPAASASVSMPFTFKALGACGGTITATLQLQDGSTNLGIVNFILPLGQFQLATTFTENFDELTPPALPSGWSTTFTGSETNWVTSANASDTFPNAAYASEPPVPGLAWLVTPSIPIQTANAQLSFMNFYDLEADPSNSPSPNSGFDGGVLEISIGTNAFQDILAAGGSFVSGGYVTNDFSPDNPLFGRPVWTGNSGGFIQTIVNLPANAIGQNIRLRWGCGTDTGNDNGGTGWFIDSISIADGFYTCCNPLVAPEIINPEIIGTNVVFSFQTTFGQTYSVQYKNDLSNPAWTTLQSLTGDGSVTNITNSATLSRRFYRIISP